MRKNLNIFHNQCCTSVFSQYNTSSVSQHARWRVSQHSTCMTSKSSELRQDMSSVPISHVPSVTLNPTACDSLFNYILGICEPIISQTNTNIYKESWHLGFRSHRDTQQNRHYQIIKRTHFQGRRHEASAREIWFNSQSLARGWQQAQNTISDTWITQPNLQVSSTMECAWDDDY